MKTLLLLFITTLLSGETIVVHEGFERAIARYKSDACSAAKAQAREKYASAISNSPIRSGRKGGNPVHGLTRARWVRR